MNPRHVLFALLASLSCAGAGAARADALPDAATVAIGGTSVALPILPGFAAPDTTPKVFFDVMARALPSTNRLVAVMLPSEFLARVAAGDRKTPLSRYIGIQSFPAYEQDGMTPAMFDQVKAVLRTQSAQVLERAKAAIGESADRLSSDVGKITGDSSTSIKTGDASSLGVFDEQPDSISLVMLQTVSATTKGGSQQVRQVMALSGVTIHGKPLLMGIYSNDESQDDVDWVKAQTLDWLRRVQEVNP